MNEPNPIVSDLVMSGLFEAMKAQEPPATQALKVLSAMALLADPNTREVTKRVDEITWKTLAMMSSGSIIFPEQVAGVIQQLCDADIVAKVSEGDTPTWLVAANYKRLGEVGEMIAKGDLTFSHVDPGPTDFEERGRGRH